jgi:hypothetical protein
LEVRGRRLEAVRRKVEVEVKVEGGRSGGSSVRMTPNP